jgi:hypothetical protein
LSLAAIKRFGTRIPCQIPATVMSLDPLQPFSEACQIILVNPGGCTARFPGSMEIGTGVRLKCLTTTNVTGRVVNCISLGRHEKLWLLGIA